MMMGVISHTTRHADDDGCSLSADAQHAAVTQRRHTQHTAVLSARTDTCPLRANRHNTPTARLPATRPRRLGAGGTLTWPSRSDRSSVMLSTFNGWHSACSASPVYVATRALARVRETRGRRAGATDKVRGSGEGEWELGKRLVGR